jgi:uncharacterized tellurite resistance protein B-like protein/DNA polymerase III delta prime subunit
MKDNNEPENRHIYMSDGNYNERIERDYIQGNIYSYSVNGSINLNRLGGKQKSNNIERPLTKDELKNRKKLLNHVENQWIPLLKDSLHLPTLIELELENRRDAVKSPFEDVLAIPDAPANSAGTSITDVFIQQEAQTLLILGEPGSGKTTILLKLAQELIANAREDQDNPIPVILNLSSWRPRKPQKFADWIVHELNKRYKVPRTLGEDWVKDQRLLVLLDGLDEVKPEFRKACVNSLQQFLNEHNLTEIVVCCRIKEYEAISVRLELQRAIYIQPLTLEQVKQVLEMAGNQLESVRRLLETDPILQELAKLPLMLNIMAQAYKGIAIENLPKLDSIEKYRQHLFNKYIEEGFNRTVTNARYSEAQARHWLTWLAQRMLREPESESQTIFLIEQMQPNWLKLTKEKWIYHIGLKLRDGIRAGFITTVLVTSFISVASPPRGLTDLLSGGLSALLLGLIVGSIAYFRSNGMTGDPAQDSIKTVETLQWSWERAVRGLRIALPVGISMGVSYGYGTGWIVGTIIPQHYGGFITGIVTGVILGLIFGLIYGLNAWLDEGLSGPRIEKKVFPNQGIKQSAISAIILVVIGSSIIGSIIGLLNVSLTHSFVPSSFVASILGLCLIFNKAGDAVTKHIILRISLYFNGQIPWDFFKFLEYAKKSTFVNRVGGGYKFYHRIIMEHFASSEPDPLEKNLTQIKFKKYFRNKWLSQQYVEILEICQSLLKVTGGDNESSIKILVKLYYTPEGDNEAESLEQKALQILKSLIDENYIDLATTLNNIGVYYDSQRNYSESEALYQRALDLLKYSNNKDTINYAICLNNLAQCNLTLCHYKEAERLYKQVLKLRKRLQKNNHADIVECCNKLKFIRSTLKQVGRN